MSKPYCRLEALENRRLLSGTIVQAGNGVVTVTGTTSSDTISAGVDPNNSALLYFQVITAGQSTVFQEFATSTVTGVQVLCDPSSSSPTGPDADFVNVAGTNFPGSVSIVGGPGSDTILGQLGPNLITTGTASTHSLVFGGPGNDTIEGLGASETLRSGGGNDTIQASAGNNVLVAGRDGSQLIGGSGSDTLRSGRGNATLHAGNGPTLELGGSGNDFLEGGAGNDTIIAGTGLSTLVGHGGDDVLDAGWDSFLIFQGGNTLPATTSNDLVYGGGGNDTLISSGGSPVLTGGGGQNTYGVNNLNAQFADLKSGEVVAQGDILHGSVTSTKTVHLTIQQNNNGTLQPISIPAGAGNAPSGTSTVHASDASGTIVFQTDGPRTFTLQDFFTHWGVNFTNIGIGQFVATPGSGHSLAMTVNGVNNTQLGAYAVQNGDNIVITFNR